MKALLCRGGFLAFGLFGVVKLAGACGIDWVVPSNHFDGVNEFGKLSYWRSIGEVDFGDGLKVPLAIGFNPTRRASPYLGKGWTIALLESNVVQVDEKKFLLTQPDGISRQFWRKSPTDTILKGQGNWQGEINGDSITLWADCGWKLTFKNGRNTSITTPKNRVLNLGYANGRVSEIRENGKTLLKVDTDLKSGKVSGLTYGKDHIGFELGDKPRVDVAQGLNVVGGIEQSLHKLTLSDGSQVTYNYGVDDKLRPTLKISGGTVRSFTWVPVTGQALKDGVWTYNMIPGPNSFANTQIGRTNEKKETEYWFEDKVQGKEIEQSIDGTKTIRMHFIGDLANGLVRKISIIKNGNERVTYKAYIDDHGQLIREVRNDYTVNYKDGLVSEIIDPAGLREWIAIHDRKGFLEKETIGGSITVSYFSNGKYNVSNIPQISNEPTEPTK